MALNHTRCVAGIVLISIVLPVIAQDSVPATAFTAGQLVPDMDNATTIWDNACTACHGELGQGSHAGVPDIRNTALSLSEIMRVVKAGLNTMPAFAGFTPQELLDVSSYVKEEL